MTTHPGYCALIDTAFGTCGLAWNERGVTRLLLPQSNRAAVEAKLAAAPRCEPEDAPAHIARLTADIRRYFAGEEIDFSAVTVELSAASDFERGIYRATRGIGFGRTVTYGELARRAGFPGAARDTGQALGRNPVPLIVPCHRVVASDGRLGGFSAPGGRATKERMLTLEGALLPL